MEIKALLLVLSLVLAYSSIGVSGLYCFQCNYRTDQNGTACLKPMGSSVKAVLCDPDSVCFIRAVVLIDENAQTSTSSFIRQCEPSTNTCDTRNRRFSTSVSQCYRCTSSYCNGSSGVVLSLLIFVCGMIFTNIM